MIISSYKPSEKKHGDVAMWQLMYGYSCQSARGGGRFFMCKRIMADEIYKNEFYSDYLPEQALVFGKKSL